jgi:hypothetical protein
MIFCRCLPYLRQYLVLVSVAFFQIIIFGRICGFIAQVFSTCRLSISSVEQEEIMNTEIITQKGINLSLVRFLSMIF